MTSYCTITENNTVLAAESTSGAAPVTALGFRDARQ